MHVPRFRKDREPHLERVLLARISQNVLTCPTARCFNRLDTVTDSGAAQPPLEHSYTYDANGNLERDPNKGITTTFNHLDLPKVVSHAAQNLDTLPPCTVQRPWCC